MNLQSILLLALILAAAVGAWRLLHRHGGGSCHGCNGNCGQCRVKEKGVD